MSLPINFHQQTGAQIATALNYELLEQESRIRSLEGSAIYLNPRGDWVTGEIYYRIPGQQLDWFLGPDGKAYLVAESHTSGVFLDDLADGKFFENDVAQLRADLAGTGAGQGAEMVAYQAEGAGAVPRMLEAKLSEAVSVADFGGDFASAFAASTTVMVPYGASYGTSFSVPAGKRLVNHGTLTGTVSVGGAALLVSDSVTLVGTANVWTNYPAGTTTFQGDFSSYSSGQMVAIELTTAGSASFNQRGIDFGSVVSASSTELVIDTPTRWPFDVPRISKAIVAQVTGSVARGDVAISGDYTALFQVGDIVRVENRTGVDTIDASLAYFEMQRVKSITTGAVVFENSMAYSHTNPVLAKADFVADVVISGGYIDTIVALGVRGLSISDVNGRLFSCQYLYDFRVDHVRTASDQPRGHGYTWCRNGTVSDVVATDSTGVTDNAAFKNLSCIGVAFSNIRGYSTSASAQGVYPFFVDYFFVPYKGYNQDCTYTGIVADMPVSGANRSAWMVGLRGGAVVGMSASSVVQIERSRETVFSGIHTLGQLNISNSDGIVVTGFSARLMNVTGGPRCQIGPGVLRGALGTNSNRTVWVRGGTLFTGSDGVMFDGVKSLSTNTTDVTFYLQNSIGIWLSGCSDQSGIVNSIQLGSSVSYSTGVNRFFGVVANSASSNGLAQMSSDLVLTNSGWDRRRLVLGGYYIWVDQAGALRIKSGAPTTDGDGIKVGLQT